MYVVVQHGIRNPEIAFTRGQRLMTSEGAPAGVRNLQFYPSRDQSRVTCLWEAPSVQAVRATSIPRSAARVRTSVTR